MRKLIIPIKGVDKDYLSQLEYALAFASEDLASCIVNEKELQVEAELKNESARESAAQKIQELINRYEKREFGLPTVIHFRQDRDLTAFDAWGGLLEKKWATLVGTGHVILRGPAAKLMSLIDSKVQNLFANEFKAELEIYPSTIQCKTLDRCHHFTSFPEHMDFVAHLKQDVQVLNDFSNACRDQGWSPAHHQNRMAEVDFAVAPSCCYHCYEGMEGWDVPEQGRCITAILACHRYEGANHRSPRSSACVHHA
jgi:hypothetical protein